MKLAAWAQQVGLHEGTAADEPVRDMTEVPTSMCARLYGRRSAARLAQAAVAAAGAGGTSLEGG